MQLKKTKAIFKTHKKVVPLSKSLINHLYSQNVKNYNPYLATLSQLEDEHKLG